MKSGISFDLKQTKDPDKAVGHSRYVVNPENGIGIDELTKVIGDQIPVVDDIEAWTDKIVIRIDRYECPCCSTNITALIKVTCQGRVTPEWDEVEGLYQISMHGSVGHCEVSVSKLTKEVLHEGRGPELPRKDYKADEEAVAEITERDETLAEMARKNPAGVINAGAINTPEDMESLAQAAMSSLERKLLVIDDTVTDKDPMINIIANAALRFGLGVEVCNPKDLREMLMCIAELKPHVILLDNYIWDQAMGERIEQGLHSKAPNLPIVAFSTAPWRSDGPILRNKGEEMTEQDVFAALEQALAAFIN